MWHTLLSQIRLPMETIAHCVWKMAHSVRMVPDIYKDGTISGVMENAFAIRTTQ